MKCEKCGEMNVEGAEVCSNCGASLVSIEPTPVPPAPPATPIVPLKTPRRGGGALRVGIFVVLLLALLGGGVSAYQYWFGLPVLESLVPAGSAGYACGDARWLWDNTSDVRAEPKVTEGLRQLEGKLGFSLAKDVVPWAGNVAVAVIDVKGANPNVAIYVQVKDQRRFYDTVQRVRLQTERRSGLQWAEQTYQGVPMRQAMLRTGGPAFNVSTFWLKGWMIVGVGNGTAERVIDTFQKRTPSIAKDANWSRALATVPPDAVSWFGMDGGAIQKLISSNGLPGPTMASYDSLTVCSTTPKPDGFRMDSFSIPTTDAARKTYTDLAQKVTPLTEELYPRLPDGTFVTLMASKPVVWLDMFKKAMLEATPDPQQRKAVDDGLKQVADLESAVRQITGDAGAAITWQKGKGFGAVMLADMGSETGAKEASDKVARFAEKHQQKLAMTNNGTRFTLVVPNTNTPPEFKVAPTWETSGKFFAFGTHPMWLEQGTAADRPRLPDEAKGAVMVMQGDFRSLEPIVEDVSKRASATERATAMGIAKDTRLSNAHWISWSKINDDGTTTGVAEISGWQWHDAIKALTDRVHGEMAKRQG